MNSTRKASENASHQVAGDTIGSNSAHPFRSARRPVFAVLFSAIGEGLEGAARYEALSRKTNGELADLGVERADLPRFVMFGGA
jgi:uncharacterized protein YjiS (DUF1127 family)